MSIETNRELQEAVRNAEGGSSYNTPSRPQVIERGWHKPQKEPTVEEVMAHPEKYPHKRIEVVVSSNPSEHRMAASEEKSDMWMGKNLTEMSRNELMAALRTLGAMYEESMRQHRDDLDRLT